MERMADYEELLQAAKLVLAENDQQQFSVPAVPLYPHQWLWDSAFTAIGLRHNDPHRAQVELLRLFEAQWTNGMVPHMVHAGGLHSKDARVWRSWINPNAPEAFSTSGITQPPVLVEAVVKVAECLAPHERKSWLKLVFPNLVAYHEWLYRDRDPHQEGLVLQIHPWETGLDNTPPWMSELHEHQLPLWVAAVKKLRLSPLFNWVRNDTKLIPADQRMSTIDALALYCVQRRLRRKQYDIKKILSHSLFAIEDVSFNAIFIRNNQLLTTIAQELHIELPESLQANIKNSETAFAQLWDPYSEQYYSREFVSHRLLKEPSIGSLIALYSGIVPKENADKLVRLLEDPQQFGSAFPVASVPLSSTWFDEYRYWQGPTWINTNWLVIDGLERSGYPDHAAALRESTLELLARHGSFEYFNPISGEPAGAANFSWSAALAIDLCQQLKNT